MLLSMQNKKKIKNYSVYNSNKIKIINLFIFLLSNVHIILNFYNNFYSILLFSFN